MYEKSKNMYSKTPLAMFWVISAIFVLLMPGCAKQDYIAHAGGSVHRYLYSNSLEAVENALSHDMKYIELDLSITSDNQLVAWHDWEFEWNEVPSHNQFMARKIYNLFSPMDFAKIDSIMMSHPDLSLVTDKISDPITIDFWFHKYKRRVWVECFRDEDYFTLQRMGYNVLMSRVPPIKSSKPATIRNYTFNRFHCPDISLCDGDCFALFGGEISQSEADSIFAIDKRIRFVYIDFYE